MKKNLLLVLLTTTVTFLFSCSVAEPPADLEWSNGWVRALPSGSGMTAAYGLLRNNSGKAIELTTYDSSAFAIVGLHESYVEDGISRMREKEGIQIAAGGTLQLQPGGLHLMLMKPTAEFEVGESIEIGISSAGTRFVFMLPVESR